MTNALNVSGVDLAAAKAKGAVKSHVSTASVVVNGRTVYAATYVNGVRK